DKVRLKLILRGKRLGFSLAETGRIFELYDLDETSASQLKLMIDLTFEKKEILKQQLEDINAVLVELDDLGSNCKKTLAQLTKQH
ncbi:MAG: MerR family DNA-binding protein, partial [Colwellia sp.]|nr:MerR family DNA-binding protein [Colwellia sp.]